MKFYLDEDISPKVAHLLRKHGVDAVSAHDIGMAGASDEDQFAEAVARKAALVTRNRDDFIALTVNRSEASSRTTVWWWFRTESRVQISSSWPGGSKAARQPGEVVVNR